MVLSLFLSYLFSHGVLISSYESKKHAKSVVHPEISGGNLENDFWQPIVPHGMPKS